MKHEGDVTTMPPSSLRFAFRVSVFVYLHVLLDQCRGAAEDAHVCFSAKLGRALAGTVVSEAHCPM